MSFSPGMGLLMRRGIVRGFLTLQREREYVPTLLTLSGIAVVAQLLLLLWLTAQGFQSILQSRLDLRLQVREQATTQDVQEFLVAVRDVPYVRETTYITKEQAYEKEKATNPDLISFLEEFGVKNPFPDTIAVSLKELGDYDAFKNFLSADRWKKTVDPSFLSHTTAQEQEVRQMLTLARTGRILIAGFIVLTICVLLFVLIELVRRRSLLRDEEIFIERLVGAPILSVLIPFAVEAAVLLCIAFVLSTLIITALVTLLPLLVPAFLTGPLAMLWDEASSLLLFQAPVLIVVEILLVPVLAFLGAYLGMRRQLKSRGLDLAIAG
jgi:cell division protein FtsX